jgi:hypothetical protein
MTIGQLASRIGRSVDTLRRWETQGLLVADRDSRGHRVYAELHFEAALVLLKAGPAAQQRSTKMASVLRDLPGHQISLFPNQGAHK